MSEKKKSPSGKCHRYGCEVGELFYFSDSICIAANADSRIVPFGMREPNELEVMRLKCKKRAIYVKNLSKQPREERFLINHCHFLSPPRRHANEYTQIHVRI